MTNDLVSLALEALRRKDFAAARKAMREFADEHPLEFQHYLILGLSELALQDYFSARDVFEEASQVFPHQAQVWFNLGVALENTGALDEAAASYEKSLTIHSEQADACGNLSNIYRKRGRFHDAEMMAHRAFELGAPKAQALNLLGLALACQGKFEAAESTYRQALTHDPNCAQALANLASLSVDKLDFSSAWPLFESARKINDAPEIRLVEGLSRLLAGDAAQGWPLQEARLEISGALRMRPTCPMWKGESLHGKRLLVLAEQGFGDVIQFCRYGRLLSEIGAELIWVVPRPLVRFLAANLSGRVQGEDEPLPDAELWLPIMSLPLATGKLDFSDAPAAPYLRAPEAPLLPRKGGNSVRHIGLVWTASPTHQRDHERSISLNALAALWGIKGSRYYAPFVNPRIDEQLRSQPIIRLDKVISDFADTAALLWQLDGLVAVDTAAAHLAGALGVRTWLLLPYCPDWRWGTLGTTTPWYPSVTLYRQKAAGDWDDVIEGLTQDIAAYCAQALPL
ncbi:MAG: tetratricopeptide repeat protein [Bdellovibrionales bacterium]